MGSDHPNALDFSDLCRFKDSIVSLAHGPAAIASCWMPSPKFCLYGVKVQSR